MCLSLFVQKAMVDRFWEDGKAKSLLSFSLISILFLSETFFIKAFMLLKAASFSNPGDVFQVSRQEFLFIALAIFFAGLLVFSRQRKWLAYYARVHASVVILFSLALLLHSGLFIITGAGLSRDYIQNYLKNPAEVNRMIIATARPVYFLAIFFNVALFILLFMLPSSRLTASLFARVKKAGLFPDLKKAIVMAHVIFLLLLEAGALLPPEEAVNKAIAQFPAAELVKSLWPQGPAQTSLTIDPEERMDGEMELEPGPDFQKLNVVLIIFESLSWKYCDVYHPGLGTTPFLERLAPRSAIVERLYAVDPHTTKALIPIIAGFYPYPEPDVFEAIPGTLPERALPHLLKKLGYRTAFFQTANNYEERPAVVANLGYEDFFGLFQLPGDGFDDVNYFGKEEMMMLEPSLAWIDAAAERPFFLTYLTLSSHHQYGIPRNFPARDFAPGKEALNRYLNAVRYIDYFIERVFEGFKQRGLLAKSIFIIVGDHGEAFGEHGLSGHNYTLWEEGIRIPGIIYAPGLIKKKEMIKGFRSLLDIAPSVCDLLGLEVKKGKFIGRSFFEPVEDDRELFFFGWSKTRVTAARKGRLKFIFRNGRPFPECYDNLEDIYDLKDLGQPDKIEPPFRAAGAELKQKVTRLAEAVAAQYREWRLQAQHNQPARRPESFFFRLEANFDDLISANGYGIFPTRTEPGRTIWLRAGVRIENPVRRPLRINIVFEPMKGTYRQVFHLKPRVNLEKLKPGEFTSVEGIFSFSTDAPPGEWKAYLGILDEKKRQYLPAEVTGSVVEDGLVPLKTITLMPAQKND